MKGPFVPLRRASGTELRPGAAAVLDSFALLCFFQQEPGWQEVEAILNQKHRSGENLYLNIINWGELYYIVRRRLGQTKAEEALDRIAQLPIEIVPVDERLVMEAAKIKSQYPISYADAFCAATAKRYGAAIISGDPDFTQLGEFVQVHLIPSNKFLTQQTPSSARKLPSFMGICQSGKQISRKTPNACSGKELPKTQCLLPK